MMRITYCLALALAAGRAAAGIQLATQSRSLNSFGAVTGNGVFDSEIQQREFNKAGHFNDLVGVGVQSGASTADGFASQDSRVGPAQLSGTLRADAFVSGGFNLEDTSESGSSSAYSVVFKVDQAADFL